MYSGNEIIMIIDYITNNLKRDNAPYFTIQSVDKLNRIKDEKYIGYFPTKHDIMVAICEISSIGLDEKCFKLLVKYD